MPRQANTADLALSDALAQRRIDASPRKLETMRQAGMLEEQRRSGLGRGLGSRAVLAEGEVDRAEYMARLLDECGNYADAVLAAFVQARYPIAKDRLERAYEQSIRAVRRRIDRQGGLSALDNALNAGSKVARYLAKERRFSPVRDRARHLGLVHRNAPMHRVMYDLATDVIVVTIVGNRDPALTEGAAAKMEVLIGDGTVEGPTPSPAAGATGGVGFSQLACRVHIAALPRLVRAATMDELTRARDAAKTFSQLCARIRTLRTAAGRHRSRISVARSRQCKRSGRRVGDPSVRSGAPYPRSELRRHDLLLCGMDAFLPGGERIPRRAAATPAGTRSNRRLRLTHT